MVMGDQMQISDAIKVQCDPSGAVLSPKATFQSFDTNSDVTITGVRCMWKISFEPVCAHIWGKGDPPGKIAPPLVADVIDGREWVIQLDPETVE